MTDLVETKIPNVKQQIFRFKLEPLLLDSVLQFAKLHQFDNRLDYQEAWREWVDEHDECISKETKRLEALGYKGDVVDKLYKSGRYYFRTKTTLKQEPVERKKYVGLNRELLKAMDEYIQKNIIPNTISPCEGFDKFCENHINLLRNEIDLLVNELNMNKEEITVKFKKTFKNRYFRETRKLIQ